MQASIAPNIQVIKQGHLSSHPLSDIKPGFTVKHTALSLSDDQRLDLCGEEALPTPPKVLDFSSPELAFKDMGPAGYGLVLTGYIPAGTALLYTGTGDREVITLKELTERDADEPYGMGWRPYFSGKFVIHINAESEGSLGGFIQHIPNEEEYREHYALTPRAEANIAHVNLDLRLVNTDGSTYLAFILTKDCHGTPDNPIMLGYSYGPEYWSKSIPQLLSQSGELLERSTYTYIPPNEFYFSNTAREEAPSIKPVRIRNLHGYALGNYSRLIDPDLTVVNEKINHLFASAGFIHSPFGCLFLNNTFIITHEKEAIVEVKIEAATSEFRDFYLPITQPDFKWRSCDLKKIQTFLNGAQKTLETNLAAADWAGAPEKAALKPHINQLTEHLYKFVITNLFRAGRIAEAKALLTAYDDGLEKQNTAIPTAGSSHYTGIFGLASDASESEKAPPAPAQEYGI